MSACAPAPDSPRDNGLARAHPALRPKLEAVDGILAREGLPFARFEVYRSPQTQARALADGRSKAGPWRSYHNFGLATDYVGVVEGRWSWDSGLPWQRLGEVFEAAGLEWAGRWTTFREMVHGQLPVRRLGELRRGNLGTRDRDWLLSFFAEAPGSPPHVGWLQAELNKALGADLDVDAVLGPMTGEALLDYSTRHGLAWAEGPRMPAVLLGVSAHVLRVVP